MTEQEQMLLTLQKVFPDTPIPLYLYCYKASKTPKTLKENGNVPSAIQVTNILTGTIMLTILETDNEKTINYPINLK